MDDRLRHLDGLRGVAALLVVLHHSLIAFDFAFYSGRAEHSRFSLDIPLSGLPLTTAAVGDLAVCIFFLLSGHVLARSFSRTRLGILALAAKRYVRLGIPILAAVLLSWALLSAGAMQNGQAALLTRSGWLAAQAAQSPDVWSAIRDGLYGALLLGQSRYDSSLWTMPIELQGSIVLILAAAVSRRLFEHAATRDFWCGVGLLVFALAMHGSFLALFGLGGAAYLLDLRRRVAPLCRRPLVIAAMTLAGLLLGTIPYSEARPAIISWLVENAPVHYGVPWRRMDPETFWHAAGAVLLLIAIDGNAALRRFFARPSLQFLGEISFPLYLVHVPLLLSVSCSVYLRLMAAQVPELAATLVAILAGWSATLIVAVALTWTVERAAVAGSNGFGRHIQAWTGGREKRPVEIGTVV